MPGFHCRIRIRLLLAANRPFKNLEYRLRKGRLSARSSLSPAALGLGAGSDSNGPLAVAVIGGLISSTLLTLVVIPSVYSLVEHRISRFHKNAIQ